MTPPRMHLTVGERTLLSIALVALSTGGTAGLALIIPGGPINWPIVAYVAIGTSVVAFGHTLATYLSTQGDLPLGPTPIDPPK